jgi:hypothetical protein
LPSPLEEILRPPRQQEFNGCARGRPFQPAIRQRGSDVLMAFCLVDDGYAYLLAGSVKDGRID